MRKKIARGVDSTIRNAVLAVFGSPQSDPSSEEFSQWRSRCAALYGGGFLSPSPRAAQALRNHYGADQSADFHRLLYSVHSYFLSRLDGKDPENWDPLVDVLGELYQSLVPRLVRHALGEYYTPVRLASFLLDEAGYDGDTSQRLLDPACGTGVFLTLAIERVKRRNAGTEPGRLLRDILRSVHGFDLNPTAAAAACVNYRRALGELAAGVVDADIPVYTRDSILDPPFGEPYDLVAGNPPWIRWDHLSTEYREATLPLWKQYGLFSLRGFEARLGGGKKDLSMLFACVAMDRYLKQGGKLAFFVTQEVLKAKGAGEGFRRFRLPDGTPVRVIQVHDFTGARPFEGAANKTAAVILRKGEEMTFPVPYRVWTKCAGGIESEDCEARPLGGLYGPWQTLPHRSSDGSRLEGNCAYRAMLGANANPYGVFWVDVTAVGPGNRVTVRNLPERGKRPIPPVELEIESELVYPVLRGADLARWSAKPSIHALLVQDPALRRGYTEEVMSERWPLTFAYLQLFREELLRRALFNKFHKEAGNPFYSQFNIATETFAPFKVVWKRMSNDLAASVVSTWDGPLGRKLLIPLETTAFIPFDDAAAAHFVCGVLNSRPVREFVKSFSSAGRGFGSPAVIRHLRLPRFDPANPVHGELSELSMRLHAGSDRSPESRLDELILDPKF